MTFKNQNQTFIELIIQFRAQFTKNSSSQNQLEMFDESIMTTMTKEPVLGDTDSEISKEFKKS